MILRPLPEFALASLVLTLPLAAAPEESSEYQAPASNSSSLFNPNPDPAPDLTLPLGDSFVPLSEFQFRAIAGSTTIFHVNSEVLNWLAGQPAEGRYKIAFKSDGQLSFTTANLTVNAGEGLVEYTGQKTGHCVIVSNHLRHDPNIVTHWDSMANGGRGKQGVGKYGGLQLLDYDSSTGQLTKSSNNATAPSAGTACAPSFTHYYNVAQYNLFSDESGQTDSAEVPDLERYVAETYSSSRATPMRAVWFSDYTRRLTGYPLAHRTHAPGTGSMHGQLEQSVPIFQVYHGYIVENPNEDVAIAGYERSLASYILPPMWADPDPGAKGLSYPMLFTGHYDLNDNMFGGTAPVSKGLDHIKTMGDLYRHPEKRQILGVIWNGGGANATTAMHPSAYDNAAEVFEQAAKQLDGRPEEIVAVGGSRSGVTALAIASNPEALPYTVKFVDATNLNTRFGDIVEEVTPTYGHGMLAFDPTTGYHESWHSTFVDPDDPGPTPRNAREMTFWNLFGETTASGVNARSLDSPGFRSALLDEVAQGTEIVFRNSTHDYSRPFVHAVEYLHNLRADALARAQTLTIQHQVFYRAGHGRKFDEFPTLTDLANMLWDGSSLVSGTQHFRPVDPNVEDSGYEEIANPDFIPLVFECPHQVGSTDTGGSLPTIQNHTWQFVGEPGGRVQVWSVRLPGTPGTPGAWNYNMGFPDGTVFPGWPKPLVLLKDVALSENPGEEFGTAVVSVNLQAPLKFYWYEAEYDPDGDPTPVVIPPDPSNPYEWETFGEGAFPIPPDPAVMPLYYPTNPQPSLSPPVVRFDACEQTGRIFGSSARTGGLSGDRDPRLCPTCPPE